MDLIHFYHTNTYVFKQEGISNPSKPMEVNKSSQVSHKDKPLHVLSKKSSEHKSQQEGIIYALVTK